jgi:hypothetical protein
MMTSHSIEGLDDSNLRCRGARAGLNRLLGLGIGLGAVYARSRAFGAM